jgi:hypothetical protein
MKLRIRGDSLRLRLSQGEVIRLRETGEVGDCIHFGDRSLDYVLVSADVDAPRARFEGDRIEVTLPRALAHGWASGDDVGIEAEQQLASGTLRLLIEKDFRCLAPRAGEEDTDGFPHPGAGAGSDGC